MNIATAAAMNVAQFGAWHTANEDIDVQIAAAPAPPPEALKTWAQAALAAERRTLCIRVVDEPESQALNARFRGKSAPTNVLAFPADAPGALGDIAICAAIVAHEAEAGGKALTAHFAHMVVHGVLHLRGMDHQHDEEAARMEATEVRILTALGFGDPYVPP